MLCRWVSDGLFGYGFGFFSPKTNRRGGFGGWRRWQTAAALSGGGIV
ncbi:hypothetical protein HMPREF9120_00671 [Neisseria sp. oral taxon 020 str. F0370]|nr:hypothetical protein HMPREF9120_00671 [Neisseria sp. oral taxon 020 str. F0370]